MKYRTRTEFLVRGSKVIEVSKTQLMKPNGEWIYTGQNQERCVSRKERVNWNSHPDIVRCNEGKKR